MIKKDEEALICDLAETYRIYDYKELPLTKVALLAVGLRDDSRIKMKLSDQKVTLETLLLAGITDRLSVLVWGRTKDGQKGINKPVMIVDSLISKKNNSKVIVFNSGKEFEKSRNKLIMKITAGGG